MRRVVLVVLLAFAGALPASAEPPASHEILTEKPSGFWTSNRPAEGGAYRYRLMAIGAVIAAIMGVVIWRVTRKK